MPCKSNAILYMLDATFGIWLWPHLTWGSLYIPGHFFCEQIFKRNINDCYCNFGV